MSSAPEASRRRRVLIISPAFPPRNTPDCQRVRLSLPYYRENGWDPIVLAVHPDEVEAPDEPALLETVPAEVPVYHCGAAPKKVARLFGLGNLGWRAWLPLARVGARLIRQHRIDLVYFSTTQFAVLPLGRVWQAIFSVPYVVDLQDPWRTNYYERAGVRRPPGGWKYLFARAQANALEPWTFRKLSGIISVSGEYLRDLRSRYPWFDRVPSDVIGFGASEMDLEVAQKMNPGCAASKSDDLAAPAVGGVGSPQAPLVTFVYTGASGPIMPHAASVLFAALREVRKTAPSLAQRLRFHFIGTSYAPAEKAERTILPLAEKYGVTDLVYEQASRAGHLECIRAQAAADLLLLCGSSDRAYSPSKLYPYFLADRPMLALVFRDSVLEASLHKLGGARVIRFIENDSAEAHAQLIEYLLAVASGAAPAHDERQEMYFRQHYLARTLTARQAALFERAYQFAQSDGVVV